MRRRRAGGRHFAQKKRYLLPEPAPEDSPDAVSSIPMSQGGPHPQPTGSLSTHSHLAQPSLRPIGSFDIAKTRPVEISYTTPGALVLPYPSTEHHPATSSPNWHSPSGTDTSRPGSKRQPASMHAAADSICVQLSAAVAAVDAASLDGSEVACPPPTVAVSSVSEDGLGRPAQPTASDQAPTTHSSGPQVARFMAFILHLARPAHSDSSARRRSRF